MIRTPKHPLRAKKNVFHYSSYWGMWSRVLTSYVDGNGVLELNLTPIPCSDRTWENDVAPIIFRNHGTALAKKDLLVEQLPQQIIDIMTENLGETLTNRLLTEDWMPLLDMPTVRRGRWGGGGLSFEECKKKEA